MKVVVVDDSKTVLLTIKALLENLGVEEENIITFADAREALSYIDTHGANIIFSDIHMPGMDGFEFVSQLLKLSKQYVSTLFIVSADEHMDNVSRMKDVGGKRFIRKPINAKHFSHFVVPELIKIRRRDNTQMHVKTGLESQVLTDDSEATRQYDFLSITEEDYPIIASQMGIKPKHVGMLIKSFFAEAAINLKKLEEAIAINDYAQIERCSHSLKGSAGNMKFNQVYEVFKKIEEAAQAEDKTLPYSELLLPCKEWISNYEE
ncbi:MAG: response regulator [Sulfuricurvum sp.]|nr:response regulator [Sulfuricurvum sp.]MDP3023544.1 response regulator [Sulfuricurvum sp.]MDP3118879.1 response regulator [Sulfuricurvum sp.]